MQGVSKDETRAGRYRIKATHRYGGGTYKTVDHLDGEYATQSDAATEIARIAQPAGESDNKPKCSWLHGTGCRVIYGIFETDDDGLDRDAESLENRLTRVENILCDVAEALKPRSRGKGHHGGTITEIEEIDHSKCGRCAECRPAEAENLITRLEYCLRRTITHRHDRQEGDLTLTSSCAFCGQRMDRTMDHGCMACKALRDAQESWEVWT